MEFHHFSHEHPLILLTEKQKYDNNDADADAVDWIYPSCNGCAIPIISKPFYSCNRCDFSLHKHCAELPQEIEHHLHPDHPLILHPEKPSDYPTCYCDSCEQTCKNFTYHCSKCDFDLDLACASPEVFKLAHESHKHPLVFSRKSALFLCDACGQRHEGSSFQCIQCCLWIHQDCASLPRTIKLDDHCHLLTLSYSVPDRYIHCEICTEWLRWPSWNYFCLVCNYFAHVDCAISKIKPADLYPNLIHFPPPDESINIINYLLQKMNLTENNATGKEKLFGLAHPEHPLTLYDLPTDGSGSYPEINMLLSNVCNGCIQPISLPFYACVKCNFYLHKTCSELPAEIRHPCHEKHPLVLLPHSSQFLSLFTCKYCLGKCNGFAYYCATCEFHLDLKCAFVPRTITHEWHKDHPLVLNQRSSAPCICCRSHTTFPVYKCGKCEDFFSLELEAKCALYPRMVSHKNDKHPLMLMYGPPKDYPQEYYCGFCKKKVDQDCWFYYCADCDQSFHTLCIPSINYLSKIKYGGTLKVDFHPHAVALAPNMYFFNDSKCKCQLCGEILGDHLQFEPAVLECPDRVCKFKSHLRCAKKRNK